MSGRSIRDLLVCKIVDNDDAYDDGDHNHDVAVDNIDDASIDYSDYYSDDESLMVASVDDDLNDNDDGGDNDDDDVNDDDENNHDGHEALRSAFRPPRAQPAEIMIS